MVPFRWVSGYFEFDRHGTSDRQEAPAGIATFLAMACIILVNPRFWKPPTGGADMPFLRGKIVYCMH